MTEPLLELRGVDKSFGPVQVLHGVNLKVYPGQVTALVGDNGAGKSTLVKTVAGIYHADAGEFFFEGKPVTFNGPKDAAGLGIEVDEYYVIARAAEGHRWRNPLWRHADGSVAEW